MLRRSARFSKSDPQNCGLSGCLSHCFPLMLMRSGWIPFFVRRPWIGSVNMRRTGCAAIAAIAFLGTGASGQTRPEAVEPPSMSTNGIAGAGGNYVGSDHCVLCHEVQTAQFLKTVHAR